MEPEAGPGPRLWPYPLVAAGILFLGTLFNQWVIGARAIAEGATARLSPDQAGRFLALGFLLEAALNPLVGVVGDRLRVRVGSRLPLLWVGAPLQALGFAAVWQEGAPTAAAILFTSACMVLVNQPWTAVLPTLAPDPRTRVRLTALTGGCGLLGSIAALVAGPLVVARGGPAALGPAGAAVFLVLVLAPAALLREPPPGAQAHAAVAAGALRGAAELLGRSRVRRVLLVQGLLGLVVLSLTASVPPAAAHLLQRPPVELNGWLAGGMLAGPLVLGLLGHRLGPGRLLGGAAALGAAVLAALALGRPASFALWAAGLMGLGTTALLALAVPPLLLAGLVDEDGARREGLMFGLGGTCLCLGQAGGSALTGGLLGARAEAAGVVAVLLGAAAVLALAGATLLLPGTPGGKAASG